MVGIQRAGLFIILLVQMGSANGAVGTGYQGDIYPAVSVRVVVQM